MFLAQHGFGGIGQNFHHLVDSGLLDDNRWRDAVDVAPNPAEQTALHGGRVDLGSDPLRGVEYFLGRFVFDVLNAAEWVCPGLGPGTVMLRGQAFENGQQDALLLRFALIKQWGQDSN